MKNIFIDTNIVIDLLGQREPFYKESAQIFSLADKGVVKLSVSALTFANTHYIISKQKSAGEAKKLLRHFAVLVDILALDKKIINLSLNDSDFKDYENAIQYYAAIENGQDVMITRNLKDYKKARLPVMTALQYICTLRNQS
jgi:predicted nucleic acid-binding protein